MTEKTSPPDPNAVSYANLPLCIGYALGGLGFPLMIAGLFTLRFLFLPGRNSPTPFVAFSPYHPAFIAGMIMLIGGGAAALFGGRMIRNYREAERATRRALEAPQAPSPPDVSR